MGNNCTRSLWCSKSPEVIVLSGNNEENWHPPCLEADEAPNSIKNKPPELIKIEFEDILVKGGGKQPQELRAWEEQIDVIKSSQLKPEQVIMIVKENPKKVDPSKPGKPRSFKGNMTVGLQVDSVLKTKTGHLKEYYTLGRELGRGQYGTTFLCVEKRTGKEYACKSIAKRRLLTMDDVDDVRREIEIMHHLSGDPNVISIKGAYEDSVAVHVVMELCGGGELFDRIVERGHYSEKKAAELTRTIVGVIEAFHSLGVMHRDLKPENFLFLNEDEHSPIKTIDFGLSVFFKPGEVFTDIVGSPYYVAPEVLCKHYGPEADVWSAGVVLYILLCGVPPFWGETEQEIFEEVLRGNIDFSSDPWPEISDSAKDLVKKMLVRDPKRRLTAHQVLCHPWVHGKGVSPDKPLVSE